ncbi:MAG TPA: hypothetical protein DDZ80_02290 [Cyanobacteria bacterium UBA8803]|nr:hypothetical protein [Cyanobacteria bacterium UBA9273]HBL57413.1 hypothetical protein [Cyanobacteria bacterium UBA8803]
MASLQKLATLIAGTTSLISLQLFGLLSSPQIPFFRHSKNFNFLAPASAQPNSPNLTLSDRVGNEPLKADGTQQLRQLPTPAIKQYVPPIKPNPRRSQGSGSRGCDQSLSGDLLTLLIPSKDYVGQTTSGYPTFFWYLSQPVSVPIKFTLVEPGVPRPLFEKHIDSPQVGMTQVELPSDRAELATGKVYIWSVTLLCNSRRPSANPRLMSSIERVPTTPQLEQQLAQVTSDSNSPAHTLRDRSLVYARSGIWYNALAEISKAQMADPSDRSLSETLLALLDQVGLTQVTAQERQRLAKN